MLATLYKSQWLEISRFDCAGHDSDGEEASLQHEIVVPLDGLFLRRDSFGHIVGDSKHLLFFNREQRHQISHPAGFGESCLLIHLDESRLLEMLRDIVPRLENQADRPFERGALRLDNRQQWQKFRFLSRLRHAQPIAIEENVLAWLNPIFQALYSETIANRPLNKQQREAVHAVQIFLNQAYCQALTLDDIAATVYYSPFMLCRLFKQAFGLSIHQYLSDLRLSMALQRLVTEPELAIGDLGMALGYNSHSHFSAAFAAAFGFSPREAREYFKHKGIS